MDGLKMKGATMGLDGVEMTMRVEDGFDIQLSDAEAGKVRTVGDLHSLVMRKVKMPAGARCLSARAFYVLRRALMAGADLERRAVRPGVLIGDVLPRKGRRRRLRAMAVATHLAMPELRRSWAVVALGTFVVLAGAVAAERYPGSWDGWSWFGLIVGSAFLGAFVAVATRPLAMELGAATVGDFVLRVRDQNFSKLLESGRRFREEEVWEMVVDITADVLGVRREQVRRESRLVEDLGMG